MKDDYPKKPLTLPDWSYEIRTIDGIAEGLEEYREHCDNEVQQRIAFVVSQLGDASRILNEILSRIESKLEWQEMERQAK
jgi:hypothetical protein